MPVALVVSALVLAAPAGSAPLVWDFESGAASFQWSDTTVSGYAATDIGTGTPFIGQFLGPFENESVDLLCIDCFDAATPYSIAFDVLVLGSWLGSTPGRNRCSP